MSQDNGSAKVTQKAACEAKWFIKVQIVNGVL